MHVLIRYLRGFSASLSSPAHKSCADSLTCHCKSTAFSCEQTNRKKQACFCGFFSSFLHAIDKHTLEHIDPHRGIEINHFAQYDSSFLTDAFCRKKQFHLSTARLLASQSTHNHFVYFRCCTTFFM